MNTRAKIAAIFALLSCGYLSYDGASLALTVGGSIFNTPSVWIVALVGASIMELLAAILSVAALAAPVKFMQPLRITLVIVIGLSLALNWAGLAGPSRPASLYNVALLAAVVAYALSFRLKFAATPGATTRV